MPSAVVHAQASSVDSGRTGRDVVRALGWFSLGLGLASVMMPRTLARSAGVAGTVKGERWLRVMGVRELIAGGGILMRPDKPGWLWSRVAGDAMDLGLLALAARSRHAAAGRRLGVLSAALTGLTVLDLLVAWDHTARLRHAPRHSPSTAHKARASIFRIKKSLDVNRSPEDCYRFWRDFDNFPRFMPHVAHVESVDATHSRWQVHGPLKQTAQWDAELTSDVPAQQLGWQAKAGADIAYTGLVRFHPAPGHRGTRIEAEFTFPTLGKAGVMLARMTGDEPSHQISEDLRRFKQLIETGEIPTTMGQPVGQRSAIGRLVHKGFAG